MQFISEFAEPFNTLYNDSTRRIVNMDTIKIDNKIKNIIHAMSSKCKSFYPEYIRSLIPELTTEEINNSLLKLVDAKEITVKYEIRCPDTNTELALLNNTENILGIEMYCRDCDEYIQINKDCIFPKYFINKEKG